MQAKANGIWLICAGSVVMISHDRFLLDRIATHILAFEDDGTQVNQLQKLHEVNVLCWVHQLCSALLLPTQVIAGRVAIVTSSRHQTFCTNCVYAGVV